MIRILIVDVDGTLMDTNYLHVEAWGRALKAVNQQIPRARIHRQIGKGAHLMLDELLIDLAVRPKAIELHDSFYEDMQQYAVPLPGAQGLISNLTSHAYEVWLATSAKSEELDHHLEALDCQNKIAGVVSSDDVDKAKPAPHIFQETLSRANGTPEESMVIGDTVWDIQSANACGLLSIAVMTGGAFTRQELQAAGAAAVFDDCRDLTSLEFLKNDMRIQTTDDERS